MPQSSGRANTSPSEDAASENPVPETCPACGVRSSVDELGHTVVYGPDESDHRGALWLRWGRIGVDPEVQRDLDPHHKLARPGVELDPDKTEAITVVAIYEAIPGGGRKLRGYRALEGQHRADLGHRQAPDAYQLCKLIQVSSRGQEAALSREISGARSNFKAVDTWRSLLRAGQPNVVAASGWLTREGYEISVSSKPKALAAAGSLFRLIGVNPSGVQVKVTKSPEEGLADLKTVLKVLAGMPEERKINVKPDRKPVRYTATLIGAVYDLMAVNRDKIDLARYAKRLAIMSPADWQAFADPKYGGRKYLLYQFAEAYNNGLSPDSPKALKTR